MSFIENFAYKEKQFATKDHQRALRRGVLRISLIFTNAPEAIDAQTQGEQP
jgi:hypothetical protein